MTEALLPTLRNVVGDVLPVPALAAALAPDQPLSEVGLDSLRTVELISALEERFGITLDEPDLRDEYFASLRGLTALLNSKGIG